MKYPLFLCALLLTMVLGFGCSKEMTGSPESLLEEDDNTTYETNDLGRFGLKPNNRWGVIINKSAPDTDEHISKSPQYILSPSDKIILAKDYGVSYIRTGVSKKDWDDAEKQKGFLYCYDQYANNGFKLLLNVLWKDQEGKPVAFAPNAADPNSGYYKFIEVLLDSLTSNGRKPPAVVVVENEEVNKLYYVIDKTSDWDKYIAMLQTTTTLCHAKGIKVANGGITARQTTFVTWNWLKNTMKFNGVAKSFAKNSMPPTLYYGLYKDGRPDDVKPTGEGYVLEQAAMTNYFLQKYNEIGIDYVNFHWYEPVSTRGWDETKNGGSPWVRWGISQNDTSTGVLSRVLKFYNSTSTAQIISNEIGQVTYSECLTNNMMTQINKLAKDAAKPFSIASWYDGDGINEYDARALHNTYVSDPLYTMRTNGIAFKRQIKYPSLPAVCSSPL